MVIRISPQCFQTIFAVRAVIILRVKQLAQSVKGIYISSIVFCFLRFKPVIITPAAKYPTGIHLADTLPIRHKEIIHEPMLEAINITQYLEKYHDSIECVSVGGESGECPDIRPLNYGWVIATEMQCTLYRVPFHFHRTGSYLIRGDKEYHIPHEKQESQAAAAGIDYEP